MKGDYLEVLNTDRKWWKVRNKSQEVNRDCTQDCHCNVITGRVRAVHDPPDVDRPGPPGVFEGAGAPPRHTLA